MTSTCFSIFPYVKLKRLSVRTYLYSENKRSVSTKTMRAYVYALMRGSVQEGAIHWILTPFIMDKLIICRVMNPIFFANTPSYLFCMSIPRGPEIQYISLRTSSVWELSDRFLVSSFVIAVGSHERYELMNAKSEDTILALNNAFSLCISLLSSSNFSRISIKLLKLLAKKKSSYDLCPPPVGNNFWLKGKLHFLFVLSNVKPRFNLAWTTEQTIGLRKRM